MRGEETPPPGPLPEAERGPGGGVVFLPLSSRKEWRASRPGKGTIMTTTADWLYHRKG
jgi:hypothetical protein